MKKSELVFNLISIPLDALMIVLAGVASFYLRLSLQSVEQVGPVAYNLQLPDFLPAVFLVLPILLLLFALLGLYNLQGTTGLFREFGQITIGVSGGLFFVIIAFFFDQAFFPSRFIVLAAWILAIAFVAFGRIWLKALQRYLFKQGYGLHRLVIVDGAVREQGDFDELLKNKKFGYQIVEEVNFGEEGLARIKQLCEKGQIDEILQANPALGEKANLELLEFAKAHGLQFSFVPNLFEVQRNVVQMSDLKGVPIISLRNSPLDGWGKVAKRVLDVFASIACLIITAPMFLVIWLAVKLDSSGPAIYSAPRAGLRREFKFYKFRSMHTHLSVGEKFGGKEAEQYRKSLWQKNQRGSADAEILKVKDDPRVTNIGKFLRRTKLDEIPQFWNVLLGDMSMVGPRAHVLDEVERYRAAHNRMFSIKPGIFGLSQSAQIFRPDLPFEEEVKLNTYYIENWSLWMDIKILIKSFFVLLFAKKPKENY